VRGVPSYGQNATFPSVVEKPQTGQERTFLSLKTCGMSGMKRKRKKNGKPASQRMAVARSEPERSRTLRR
jgi:hypothetical protein